MRAPFIGYVPVLHIAYYRLFQDLNQENTEGRTLIYLLGSDVLKRFPHLKKDLRALPPELAVRAIQGLGYRSEVLSEESLSSILRGDQAFMFPDEDIMHRLAEEFGVSDKVTWVSSFLRHTSTNSVAPLNVKADEEIAESDLQSRFMSFAFKEANLSSDWWRQVGAIAVRDETILVIGHNHHLPTEYTPYIDGDPRSDFKKGLNQELGTALHAEASVVAQAAKKGISLEGAVMYCSTFPCPSCSKLIAASGIAACYFSQGYSMLDGEQSLKNAGVKLIQITSSPSP